MTLHATALLPNASDAIAAGRPHPGVESPLKSPRSEPSARVAEGSEGAAPCRFFPSIMCSSRARPLWHRDPEILESPVKPWPHCWRASPLDGMSHVTVLLGKACIVCRLLLLSSLPCWPPKPAGRPAKPGHVASASEEPPFVILTCWHDLRMLEVLLLQF